MTEMNELGSNELESNNLRLGLTKEHEGYLEMHGLHAFGW